MTVSTVLVLLSLAASVRAQVPLTLDEAVSRAREANPDVRQADARAERAQGHVREVRAGLLPRIDVSESWQRSDLPVFAFSSLLSQRRFTAEDFELGRLNGPDPVSNFRTGIVVEQSVFDATQRAAVAAAGLGRDMAEIEREFAAQRAVVATVEAYGRVQSIEAMAAAARVGVEAADEDVRRATDRRDAGMATDADVLMMMVHRAASQERLIQAEADIETARGRLNYLIGAPLDATFQLAPIPTADTSAQDPPVDDAVAIRDRPDVRLAMSAERLAEADVSAARAAFLPQVLARGATEWNGGTFESRRSGWMVGAEVRLNLFRGFADRARLAQARATVDERRVERGAALDRARLDVRAAAAALSAASARVDLSRAAVAAARESQRITRDRYDNGLATIVDVVHASQAVLDADAGAAAAAADHATSQARLAAALGEL